MEESNYYPFGLKHKGYNSNVSPLGNATAQKFGFGGKELNQELGLEWHDFGARNYDASLGRWFTIDPKADDIMQVDITPYNYSWNNPTNVSDPDGKCPMCWGAVIGAAFEYGNQVAGNLINGQSFGDALTDVDPEKIFVSALTGAATGGLSVLKAVDTSVKVYKKVAVVSTVVVGSMMKQNIKDGSTGKVNVKDLAVDAASSLVKIPKVKVPKIAKGKIKTAKRQLNRAERVNRNTKPSRQEAVKKAKEKVQKLEKQNSNASKAEKAINKTKDKVIKKVAKDEIKERIN
nr:RHS repeat-associated core domain-containing protein [Tenacibaculum maritimum]